MARAETGCGIAEALCTLGDAPDPTAARVPLLLRVHLENQWDDVAERHCGLLHLTPDRVLAVSGALCFRAHVDDQALELVHARGRVRTRNARLDQGAPLSGADRRNIAPLRN